MLALCLLMLAQDPATADALLRQGVALAREKRLEEAERTLAEGARLFPGNPSFPVELAGVAWLRQRPDAARRQLHRALRLEPGNRYASDFLATLYLLDGNLSAALKYWNRAGKPLIQTLQFAPELPLRPILRDRAFLISPGQVFTLDRLTATQGNLDRLHILGASRFELAARDDDRFDLTFRSLPEDAPRHLLGRGGTVLPFLRGLPYQTLFLETANIAGTGTSFSSLWRWDAEKRRANVEIGAPLYLDPRKMLRLSLDARQERWLPGFTMRRYEAAANVELALGARSTWTTGLAVTRRDFRDAPNQPEFDGGWSYSFPNRFTHAFTAWPEHNLTLSAAGLVRPGRVLGANPSKFIATTGELQAAWKPGGERGLYAVQGRLRAGSILGRVPFDEFFELGMDRDNDLWLRGHSALQDGRKGAAPLGTRYSLFQFDATRALWRHPLARIEAGPFVDTGLVGGAGGRGSQGWLCDAGVQLRIRTLGGVAVTLLYGRDLRGGRGAFFGDASR